MKHIFLTFFLVVVLPLSLDARRNGEGFFIGLGSGGSHYYDNGLSSDFGASKDDISGTLKYYMGYKYDHEITLEGSVTSYGIYEFRKDGEQIERLEPLSFSIALNYGTDLVHNQLRPFVILGGGGLWLKPSENTLYSEEIFFSLHYGAGLLLTPRFLHGLGFRMAYEGDWSRFNSSSAVKAVGKSAYDNTFGSLYLGIQYKF